MGTTATTHEQRAARISLGGHGQRPRVPDVNDCGRILDHERRAVEVNLRGPVRGFPSSTWSTVGSTSWRARAGRQRLAPGRDAVVRPFLVVTDRGIPNASWAEPAVDRDQDLTLAPLVRVRHGPGGVPARRKRPGARPDFAPRRFHMPRQERGADAHPWDPRRPADAAQFCVAGNPQMLRTRRSRRGIGPRRARIVRYSRIANCARKCTRSLGIAP